MVGGRGGACPRPNRSAVTTRLTFSGPGYSPQEAAVTVEAGVKKRVDAVMGQAT